MTSVSKCFRLGAVVAVIATGAACTGANSDGANTTVAGGPVAAPTTLTPPETTTATTAPTTTAPSATVPPSTVPPSTAAPATTVAVTTTTEPSTLQELVLSGEGIGAAIFGAEPEGVIQYVSSILGGATDDTGWVPADTFAVCDGELARRVDWGTLSLLFGDLSSIASGRQHFLGYEYGRVGEIGDEPVGLRTVGGVTLGSRVVDLLAEFPDASINEGDPDVALPDAFYVSDVFYGLLTGVAQDDYVTVLFGGYGCGE